MGHRRFSYQDVSQPSKLAFSYDAKYRLNVELLIYVCNSDVVSPRGTFYSSENFHVSSLDSHFSSIRLYTSQCAGLDHDMPMFSVLNLPSQSSSDLVSGDILFNQVSPSQLWSASISNISNIFCSSTSLHDLQDTINRELAKLFVWFSVNRLSLNLGKTNYKPHIQSVESKLSSVLPIMYKASKLINIAGMYTLYC